MYTPFEGPSVWTGADLDADQSWRRPWQPAKLAEIDAALAAAKAANVHWLDVTQATFPLPTVGQVLADVAEELENGRGFILLESPPPDRYTEDDRRRV
ncbi:MAG: hypothetical protein ACKVH0_08955 [Alphaproteobacteria bacterium]